MLAAIRKWLTAPVFDGDEEKTRVARSLHTVLLTLFITPALLIADAVFTPANRVPALPAAVILFAFALLTMQYFMRRGFVRLISTVTVFLGFLFTALLSIANGGEDRPVNIYYGLVIVMAGLLLGGRGAIVAAVCSVIALDAITLAGGAGLLTARLEPPSPLIAAFTFGLGFMLIGFVLRLASDSLGAALAQARRSRAELAALAASLEQRVIERTQSISLLNAMGERLQACDNAAAAYAVIDQMARRLFPGEGGVLYAFNALRDLLEPAAAWGALPFEPQPFKPQSCQALQTGRLNHVEGAAGAACDHVLPPGPAAYICMPLSAQGEMFGVLHLRSRSAEPDARAGGEPWFNELKLQLVHTAGESMSMALANLKLRETLRQQSIRDSLTGLFNRRYMEETLQRELLRAERSHAPVGIIMLDVDNFKAFNDTYGHTAGDLVLREVGACLRNLVREEDIACRYGGEEFTLILPTASLAVTEERADRVRQKVKQISVEYEGQLLGAISVSVGIAASPAHGVDSEALLRAADAALYHAKHKGRDQIVVASAVQAALLTMRKHL